MSIVAKPFSFVSGGKYLGAYAPDTRQTVLAQLDALMKAHVHAKQASTSHCPEHLFGTDDLEMKGQVIAIR